MTVVKLSCSGVEVLAAVEGILTAGAVGIKTYIEYTDDEWYGLVKDVAFRIGSTGKSYGMMNVEDVTTVPHESLVAGKHLYIGITGFNVDKSVVIPTMWADCGVVQASAIGNHENSVPPTPTEMEQMVATVKAAQNDVNESKNVIDNAKNEVVQLAQETKQAATNAARSESEAAKSALEARNSVNGAKMVFLEIDQNGDLIMTAVNEPSVSFALNDNGDLEAVYTNE